jgi:hypothetical protein
MTEEEEKLNHQAYMDVLDCKDPSMPYNEVYMKYYRSWRPLQKYPGDDF